MPKATASTVRKKCDEVLHDLRRLTDVLHNLIIQLNEGFGDTDPASQQPTEAVKHQPDKIPNAVLDLYAEQFARLPLRVCLFQIPEVIARNTAQFSYTNPYDGTLSFELREEVYTASNESEVIIFLAHRLQQELRHKQDIGHVCKQLVIGIRGAPELKNNIWMVDYGYHFLPNNNPVYLLFANCNIEPIFTI